MTAVTREKQLEDIVRKLAPAARDILWCALVWNDHNFTPEHLLEKSNRAAEALGFPRGTIGNQVDRINTFLAHIDEVLR